jgi:NAD(P)H-nitrite reductase large subunit
MDLQNISDEKVNCVCHRISYERLINIIEEHKCQNYKDVQNHCMAGRGCGMCVPYINAYCKSKK